MKMKIIKIASLFLMVFLWSCASVKNTSLQNENQTGKMKERIVWINSAMVNCTGVSPTVCLQMQESAEIDSDKWELFYDEIKGFDFEPGYFYQLKINETQLDKSDIPADGSSHSYRLVTVLKKELDPHYFRINDIWVLETIRTEKMDIMDEMPFIEINLSDLKIYGKAGCNSFNGNVDTYNLTHINFGSIASTKMMCPDMAVETALFLQLSNVQKYEIKNLKLYFYNAENKEVLRFKKVD